MFFFSCITSMVEQKKAKARRIRNDSRSSEKDGEEFNNNNCGISFWIVFNWPEYGILSFAEHISREFLTAEFDLISCKTIRSRGKLKILYLFIVNTVTSVVCSMAIFLQFIQVISIFQFFLRKLKQIATRCHCPVTIHSPKRSLISRGNNPKTRIV